jgi:uncharacterized membrane protein (DUF485 family)
MMNFHKEIAEKTERKLIEQTQEFSTLRDRCLLVSGFGIAMVTAYLTFLSGTREPYNFVIIGLIGILMIGVGFMIYGAYSNPISRGMNTKNIQEILEKNDDYFLNEIAYNLESFNENTEFLKRLQCFLNIGIIINSIVAILGSFCIFFNQISNG